jgi:hypothetical protein
LEPLHSSSNFTGRGKVHAVVFQASIWDYIYISLL